jgi:hypothetical protein
MPLVRGETLRERLTRDGQLSIDDTVRLVRQVAGALDFDPLRAQPRFMALMRKLNFAP